MPLTIVADDLTGAADSGVQFARRGFRTVVWLDHRAAFDDVRCDVVLVDMSSRGVTPATAHARMRAFLARWYAGLREQPPRPCAIVLKMDSTLRGNFGAELRALQDVLPDAFAIVCPAFPAQGRTCDDGVVFVHGTPVHRTGFARDLLSPVADPRVATRLEAPHAPWPLELVRSGTAAMADAIEKARARGVRIAVADAETDDDLRAIASLQRVRDDVLWMGSAGLLQAVADAVLPRETRAPSYQREHTTSAAELGTACLPLGEACLLPGGACLLLVGSMSDTTKIQVAAFTAHSEYHVERIDPIALLEAGAAASDAVARAASAVMRGTTTMIAVASGDGDAGAAARYGRAHGWDAHETSRHIRSALVATGDPVVRAKSAGTIVLSGGDVARSFCERNGIRGLEMIGEAQPGIPLSRAIGANLHLVTKAGGFGHAETFHDIVSTVRTKAVT